jgi:hypothetical protein
MPAPTTASMPPDTELDNGCRVIFEALDPNDGSTVSGVEFTAGVIYVDVTQGSAQSLGSGPFMLVPGPSAGP